MTSSRRTAKKSSDREACLGIFWLVDGKLIFDILPLSKAQQYGDHLTHPRSHFRVWPTFERSGRVPRGSEYDEYPRGRVMYHPASKEFTLLADSCILKHKGLIAQIKKALHLRKRVNLDLDSHYKCPHCLRGKKANEDEDWGE
jgi:hypothetical protein